MLAQAVLELWPGATFAGGPAIEDGFYYDFELPGGATFTDDDLERIDAKMREIIAADQPFERFELPSTTPCELMRRPPVQAGVHGPRGRRATTRDGEAGSRRHDQLLPQHARRFVDMCRGPHVPSHRPARALQADARRRRLLPRVARRTRCSSGSTARRGRPRRTSHAYLHRLEEAAKRDHRKLGAELDLFSFPEEIGSGLAVFHPKGGIVRRLMEDYSRQRHEEAGYEFVYTPHITKSELFETSGHLEWYADGMYPPMELDHDHDGGHTDYYLKPMNCPFHILIFRSTDAELPRAAAADVRVRHRVPLREVGRGARPDPGPRASPRTTPTSSPPRSTWASEIASLLDFVLELLRDYGLDDFYLELSTKPDEKSIGSDEEWEEATEALRVARRGEGPRAGARPGRRRVLRAEDLGAGPRRHRPVLADVDHPGRPDAAAALRPQLHRQPTASAIGPVMIHRALFGSVERFFAVLRRALRRRVPGVARARCRCGCCRSPTPTPPTPASVAGRAAGRGLPRRRRRGRRDARQPHPPGEGREAALRAGRRRRRRGRTRRSASTPAGNEVERDVPVATFVERLRAEVAEQWRRGPAAS